VMGSGLWGGVSRSSQALHLGDVLRGWEHPLAGVWEREEQIATPGKGKARNGKRLCQVNTKDEGGGAIKVTARGRKVCVKLRQGK